MARPIEFDRNEALETAMKLFWRQGYVATSLADLLEAMQIGRSSFYAAFSDKRSLFVEALSLFADRTRQMFVDASEQTGSTAAFRRFFYETLIDAPRYRAARGCMMANTILELADVDEELSSLATHELARVEAAFRDCFAAAQSAGEYPTHLSAADLAAHMMIVNQGLRIASRKRVPRRELKQHIDTALSLLDLATDSPRSYRASGARKDTP